MREIRYGIRSVYFRTGVKDVLARFAVRWVNLTENYWVRARPDQIRVVP